MKNSNSVLLEPLGLKSLQEVSEYVRSVHLPNHSHMILSNALTLQEICYLLHLIINNDVEITKVENRAQILIHHKMYNNTALMSQLSQFIPTIHELIIKSNELGFVLITTQDVDKTYDYLMDKKASCCA